MPASALGLPIDVPWRLIAVSPDMIDTSFCNSRFPYVWRSSLAISVFEPAEEDLPEESCDRGLTYLKVTASLTGYEPTPQETELGYTSFPNVPTEKLDELLSNYFACYGALLNVAVFPGPDSGKVSTVARVDVDLDEYEIGTELSNPLDVGAAEFRRLDSDHNRIVDMYPAGGGDGHPELSLGRSLEVLVPPSVRVIARVVTYAQPVSMEAYRDDERLAAVESGAEQGTVHELRADGEGITRLALEAPQGEASLLSLSYWTRTIRDASLADYPHIVDFEPKNRDLYQASSQNGEILTASVSGVNVDKTMAHTETTETGLSHTGKYSSPETPYGKFEASHTISHKWGETDQDATTVGIDGARDRRERHGSTTNISQMYNLLTGYHSGTNRASFLMLPRPHLLQPTDRRTFVRGLRVIEGIQEFFLVVERGVDTEGLCIDVRLETGHFPEKVEVTTPEPVYEEQTERLHVTVYAKGGGGITGQGADTRSIEADPSATYTAPAGWVMDRSKGDAGHPGMAEVANDSNGQANSSLRGYNYRAVADGSALVSGQISGANWWGSGASFDRTYDVFIRSEKAQEEPEQPQVTTPFFITRRDLCVCYRAVDGCPEVVAHDVEPVVPGRWIVDEPPIRLPDLRRPDLVAVDALRQVQMAMANSWRMPSRRPPGTVGFLESDYFLSRIGPYLPDAVKDQELPGAQMTVGQLFSSGLGELSLASGVSTTALAALRRTVLRVPEDEAAGER